MTADLIILARRIYSFARGRGAAALRAEGLAVADGRIAALAARRALLRLRGRRTRVIDLGDGAVTPGLVDAHTHLMYWALRRAYAIDVSDCRSLEATLRRIRSQARRRRFGQWIVAGGFDYNTWPEGRPQARDLDRAIADQPVLVGSRDGHTVWLNSAAMKLAGIDARRPDPPGGRYLRDRRGRPIGIVQEAAIEQLPDPVLEFARRSDRATLRKIDAAFEAAFAEAHRLGIVGVHSMDYGESLAHLQRLRSAGRLTLRVVHAVALERLDEAIGLGLRSGLGDDWVRLGGVKIFADGALGSQTAWMLEPYPGQPGYCGVPVVAGQQLAAQVEKAARAGWAVWIHAIGDRAVREAIDAIAAARRVEPQRLAHRIEHVQCIRPRDARRMARLGIVASVQPCHLPGDIHTAERHWPGVLEHAFAYRTLAEAGVVLAMGSDVPIETIDPRKGLFGAVCRTTLDGYPLGGFYPRQRLGPVEVLRGYTLGSAVAAGDAAESAALAPGGPADLTLWYDDPLRADRSELMQVRIAGCVVAGRAHVD